MSAWWLSLLLAIPFGAVTAAAFFLLLACLAPDSLGPSDLDS